ncbi:MAG TPA: hypothetical protein VFC46_04650 [Humisphaera sp.]|nr:hypothetical protein [Humisphaera sp.]
MRFALFVVPLLCLFALAADEKPAATTVTSERPKSPQAVAAIDKYDRAIRSDADDRQNAVLRAQSTLIAELKPARAAAMKRTDLDEANRIDAALKAAEGGATEYSGAPTQLPPPSSWHIFYSNGVRTEYVIDRAGTVARSDNHVSKLQPDSAGSYVASWDDGKVERLTFMHGQLFIEHFDPASLFPDKAPSNVAIGMRISAGDKPSTTVARPKSAQAVVAMDKFDRAVKSAVDGYHIAVLRSKRTLIAELKPARVAAMKQTDLDEANRIDSAMKSADGGQSDNSGAIVPLPLPSAWHLLYSNGFTADYSIDRAGTATRASDHKQSKLRTDSVGRYVASWDDGKIERLTFLHGRLFVEHFNPASQYPDQEPNQVANGTSISR